MRAILVCLIAAVLAAQTSLGPISKPGFLKGVEAVSKGAMSSAEFISVILDRGVNFQLTEDEERSLRRTAPPQLFDTAKENYRPGESKARAAHEKVVTLPEVPPGAPLDKGQILILLQAKVPLEHIEKFIQSRGVAFSVTPAATKELMAVGCSFHLLGAMLANHRVEDKPVETGP